MSLFDVLQGLAEPKGTKTKRENKALEPVERRRIHFESCTPPIYY